VREEPPRRDADTKGPPGAEESQTERIERARTDETDKGRTRKEHGKKWQQRLE